MGTYSIKTTRTQEIGLDYSYNTFADKEKYPTTDLYFQAQIDHLVTNPMYVQQQQSQIKSFDKSFETIPDDQKPAAATEVQDVIVAHGGTIVPANPPPIPFPPLTVK